MRKFIDNLNLIAGDLHLGAGNIGRSPLPGTDLGNIAAGSDRSRTGSIGTRRQRQCHGQH